MRSQLRFYNPDMPPVLHDGIHDVSVNNYIVGGANDPHWRLYSKTLYPSSRYMFPISHAVTDYAADAKNYVYYQPETHGPTWTYSRMLRDHFEHLHSARDKLARAENEKHNLEKKKQLETLLKEQKKLLEKHDKDLVKLKAKRSRAIRTETRSGIQKTSAENKYDKMNPGYNETMASISVIQNNIKSLTNELKSYT